MLPHIIQTQIDEAKAVAESMRSSAGDVPEGQPAIRARFLLGARAIDDMCQLATQLGQQAILNRDTIVNRRAS